MAHIEVRVFGKLRLQNGDARLEHFPTRRVEELFGYLLIHQRSQLSRETLVDVLWPDSSQANGRASLSTALWRLKSVFDQINSAPQDYINAHRDWVSFSPSEPIVLDLINFEKQLDRAYKTNDINERIDSLQGAIALYAGQFCEGIYAEWCLVERERLERLYLRALGMLMSIRIDQGEYDRALPHGKKILSLDPLREEVHRAMMHCYWALDRRVEAVRQFQICARMLQRELNVLPMADTIDLYRRIVDERILEKTANGTLPNAFKKRLDLAYESFLSAADELNSLIEEGSAIREPAPHN